MPGFYIIRKKLSKQPKNSHGNAVADNFAMGICTADSDNNTVIEELQKPPRLLPWLIVLQWVSASLIPITTQ